MFKNVFDSYGYDENSNIVLMKFPVASPPYTHSNSIINSKFQIEVEIKTNNSYYKCDLVSNILNPTQNQMQVFNTGGNTTYTNDNIPIFSYQENGFIYVGATVITNAVYTFTTNQNNCILVNNMKTTKGTRPFIYSNPFNTNFIANKAPWGSTSVSINSNFINALSKNLVIITTIGSAMQVSYLANGALIKNLPEGADLTIENNTLTLTNKTSKQLSIAIY